MPVEVVANQTIITAAAGFLPVFHLFQRGFGVLHVLWNLYNGRPPPLGRCFIDVLTGMCVMIIASNLRISFFKDAKHVIWIKSLNNKASNLHVLTNY